MSYTTPPTFASGTVVTASNLNILSSDVAYLKVAADGVAFSGFRAHRVTNQSISNGVATDVTYTAEDFDVGSWWSSGATATVPASAVPSGYSTVAVYALGIARFQSNSSGNRGLYIMKNGSEVDHLITSAINGDNTTIVLPTVFTASAADTIKLQAYQSSGGALNVEVAHLIAYRIAPVS